MIKYSLNDGIDFVTDEHDLIIAIRVPDSDSYSTISQEVRTYIIGSTPTSNKSGKRARDKEKISKPPVAGEHMVVQGYPPVGVKYKVKDLSPPAVSPPKIVSIDDHFEFTNN